ncbi:MAG: protein translocase subunit SecF [Treponema sp.]|nr:protein translocase subunit SecF [Treponema sp.]
MRKIIPFSRMFIPATILSTVLILGGITLFFVRGGFNLGVDFQAGMVQEVRFAPTAFTLTWDGDGTARVAVDGNGIHIINSGAGMEMRSRSFLFGEYPTVGEITRAMQEQLPGLSAELRLPAETASQWLTRGATGSPLLGAVPFRIHWLDPAAREISVANVREVIEASMDETVVIQSMGQPTDRHFLIRVQGESGRPMPQPTETEPETQSLEGDETQVGYADEVMTDEAEVATGIADVIEAETAAGRGADGILDILEAHFGEGEVMVLRSDFVDSRFAGHLTDQIGILIAATLLLVLLYASIRFRLQYAVGAVLGIVHDGIVVVAFVVLTRMEFNTTTIAAILTILGYSTNNTIVVFDRIRENRRLYPEEAFIGILNRSLTETLNRTIITTVTTMLAVMSLYIFTTGAMRDFAQALMVGMVSGVYTTTFIVTAFMTFWENRKVAKTRKETAASSGRTPGKPALSKA